MKLTLFLLALLAAVLFSCKKEETEDPVYYITRIEVHSYPLLDSSGIAWDDTGDMFDRPNPDFRMMVGNQKSDTMEGTGPFTIGIHEKIGNGTFNWILYEMDPSFSWFGPFCTYVDKGSFYVNPSGSSGIISASGPNGVSLTFHYLRWR
ncbi:MAG: hypothetical protein AB1458_09245 [Bacteroidota bacterium]